MKVKHKKKKLLILVLFIISLQLFNIIRIFAIEKTGDHSDEVWSYGLANSHNKPYIFADNHRTRTDLNANSWITGKDLNDYITVQTDERFDYANVVSNLKYDEHPPLYFIILHTICSFFPDTYSKWFAFSINIVCFVLTMLFLMQLTWMTTNSIIISILNVLYFGFCTGGVSLFIFNRHYALAAMFFFNAGLFSFSVIQRR